MHFNFIHHFEMSQSTINKIKFHLSKKFAKNAKINRAEIKMNDNRNCYLLIIVVISILRFSVL